MRKCVFCQIIEGKIKSKILYENDKVIIIKDINPRADYHFLVISKKHIPTLKDAKKEDKEILGEMLYAAKIFAKRKKLTGYKIVFNVGKKGGQIIPHLHCHIISGKIKAWP